MYIQPFCIHYQKPHTFLQETFRYAEQKYGKIFPKITRGRLFISYIKIARYGKKNATFFLAKKIRSIFRG